MTRSARPTRRAETGPLDPHAGIGPTPGTGEDSCPTPGTGEDIDTARREHRELVSFLEGAPESARRWAEHEIAAADDALAALSHTENGSSDTENGSSARRSARRPSARRPSPRRIAIGTLALAVTAGIVVGVYHIGGGQGKAKSQEGGAAESQALNPAQEAHVSRLMDQLAANPKNVATLIALGDIYFEAHNYNTAGGWMKRAVAVAPGNLRARMALGAAEFNIGDVADAQKDWLRVVAADPKDVEVYYDLGFVYVSREPPDMTDARKVWDKVIALAPNSSEAKTVAMHIKGLTKG